MASLSQTLRMSRRRFPSVPEDSPFRIGPGTRTGFVNGLPYVTRGHRYYSARRARGRRTARMPHTNRPPTRFTA